jgi:L-alanine-DL-glutamate epimerase-like enolase superfamily enzyme
MATPFGHARATRTECDNLVLIVEVDGVSGVGECVPRDYVTGETVDAAFDAICDMDLAIAVDHVVHGNLREGVATLEAFELPRRLSHGPRPGLAAACAVELALLDVLGKRTSTSLRETVNAMDGSTFVRDVGAVPRRSRALDTLGRADDLMKGPYPPDHVKLKGTKDAALDVARARAVRDTFGDSVTLSVDANMAWSLADAISRVDLLRPFDVAWYEEPLRQYAWDDYRHLREQTAANVMLDESLCSMDDGRRAVEAGACDLFNVRISKHGGLVGALRLAAYAQAHGLGVHLGVHPGQSGVLGAAGAHFLRSVESIVAFEGGGTWIGTGGLPVRLIAEELQLDHVTRRCHGLLPTGLGVTPQRDAIEHHATRRASFRDGAWSSG